MAEGIEGLRLINDTARAGWVQVETDFPHNASNPSGITIQEENSSDNFPALGHLDGFQIQTTEDGTILPSTVNAKMADGSYKRVTLYPQFIDGNVTCMVQFEEDQQETEKPPLQTKSDILDKIDQLILKNDNVVSSVGLLPFGKVAAPQRIARYGSIIAASQRQRQRSSILKRAAAELLADFKAKKSKPSDQPLQTPIAGRTLIRKPVTALQNAYVVNTQRTNTTLPSSIPYANGVQPINVISLSSRHPPSNKIKRTEITRKVPKVIPAGSIKKIFNSDVGQNNSLKSVIPEEITVNPDFFYALPSEQIGTRLVPTSTEKPVPPLHAIAQLPKLAAKINECAKVPSKPLTSKTRGKATGDDIFVKSCSKAASSSKTNQTPLGSDSNPITLIQKGKTFQSKQPLSEVQIRQITAILKKHSNPEEEPGKNFVLDSETNTRIVYKVVYPDDDPKRTPPLKLKRKRGRKRKLAPAPDINNENKTKEPVAAESSTLVPSNEDKAPSENVPSDKKESSSPVKHVITMPRTRSGRLSRPPARIVKDYNRIKIDPGDDRFRTPITDHLIDYEDVKEPPPLPNATPVMPVNQYLAGPRSKKKSNFSGHRCPVCKKIYLGSERMMEHLERYHDPACLVDYRRKMSMQKPIVVKRRSGNGSKSKLIRLLKNMDRAAYGPILAKTFSMWEFLLLRINQAKKADAGVRDVETLLQELYGLIERLGRVLEELLVPVYAHEDGKEDSIIRLDKHEVAYAMGMAQGCYKVNPTQLHLLRLPDMELYKAPSPAPPPPPPPPPSVPQLATQFEPNLSNKFECSNDSIDMDSSSKDVEHDDEKKEWESSDRVEDTNSQFLAEFLKNDLPSAPSDEVDPLWKDTGTSAAAVDAIPWDMTNQMTTTKSLEQPEMWKNGESPCAADNGDLWKQTNAGKEWNEGQNSDNWKGGKNSSWKEKPVPDKSDSWTKKTESDVWGSDKEAKKDWMRWKDDSGVVPGMRTSRLTSTPETTSALFTTPIRRNSVSSFASSHQEELLSLDLHELFDDLIQEQTKPQPKPSSIESIINEALMGDNPTTSHSTIPPSLIEEVTNLDFLNQD